MNPEFLLDYFDRISDAPDAVPRLRTLILDLAVHGKIVPQNPNEEPSPQLLERIQAEEKRRCQGTKVRKGRRAPSLTPDEIPFELPQPWIWLRLGELGITQTGTTPSSSNPEYFGDYIPFIKPADLTGYTMNYSGDGISKRGVEHSRLISRHSVLMVCIGSSIGKVNLTDRDICCNQQINTVTPHLQHLAKFTSFALKASYFQKLVRAKAGMGTLSIISKGKWEMLPIPLPPLGEQQRIVAKVDELMGLCDRLESVRAERENRRDHLTAASLHHLSSANAEAVREHACFYFRHLPRMTTRPTHIQQLRRTILNLAVRGQLLPQDTRDKVAFISGAISKERPRARGRQDNRADEPSPNELPCSWKWHRLETVSELITDGEHATPPRIHEQQIPLVTAKNVRDGSMDYGNTDWVSHDTAVKAWKRCRPSVGDVLLVCVGATTGRLCILREPRDMVLVRSVALIRPTSAIEVDYLALVLRSPFSQRQIWEKVKVTAQPCLYINRIKSLSIPLPPLAEQNRIVANVDELMVICDRLEAQLTTAQTESRRLLEAVLHQALAVTA